MFGDVQPDPFQEMETGGKTPQTHQWGHSQDLDHQRSKNESQSISVDQRQDLEMNLFASTSRIQKANSKP